MLFNDHDFVKKTKYKKKENVNMVDWLQVIIFL